MFEQDISKAQSIRKSRIFIFHVLSNSNNEYLVVAEEIRKDMETWNEAILGYFTAFCDFSSPLTRTSIHFFYV